MTKTELMARQAELPGIQARLKEIERVRSELSDEQHALQTLEYQLREMDEVFEGQPIEAFGQENFQARELGDDGGYRSAYVNPVWPDDEDAEGPTHYLLQLSGAGGRREESTWKKYTDREQAVLAAKRFAAHGVVPLPDCLKES